MQSQEDQRDSGGKWKKGVSGNPAGFPAGGYQSRTRLRYADRLQELREEYSTGDLLDLMADKKAFRKLSVRDAQIVRHLVNTLVGDDIRLEREQMLDRLEGKVQPNTPLDVSGQIVVQIMQFANVELTNEHRRHIDGSEAGKAQTIDVRVAERKEIPDARQEPYGQRQGAGDANEKQG